MRAGQHWNCRADKRVFRIPHFARTGSNVAMNQTKLNVLFLSAVVLGFGDPASAADPVADFRSAREALARAVDHYGGVDAIDSIVGLEACWRRVLYHDLQASAPDLDTSEIEPGRTDTCVALDRAGDRSHEELVTEFTPGYLLHFQILELGETAYTVIPFERQWVELPRNSRGIPTLASWFVPQLLLERAMQNLSSLRLVGPTTAPGAEVTEIEYAWDERNRYRLAIEPSGRIRGLEMLRTDPLHGIDNFRFDYESEARHGEFVVPARVQWRRRGQLYLEAELQSIAFNPDLPEERFALPPEFTRFEHSGPPVRVELAPGVSEIRVIDGFSYRAQVVEFDDFLAVFDAPVAPFVTQRVLAKLREDFADKPLRYVIMSHHHDDHVAGLRPFVEAGASIVTTPGNEDLLTRVVNADPALTTLTGPARLEPDFVLVEDRWEIGDGRLVVRRMDARPHVDDMLLAVLPGERMVINGDLYSLAVPFNSTFARLLEWLDEEDTDIDTVLGVHHPPISLEELRRKHRRWLSEESLGSGAAAATLTVPSGR